MYNLNPTEAKEVYDAAIEVSGSLTRTEAENDLRKDVVANMKEKYEIKPADFNKIVKIYHDQAKSDIEAKHQDLIDFYDSIFTDTK